MQLRSFARGGLFGLVTLVVEKGVALLLVIALARALSPVDFGRYSFLVAYLTLFQVLADLGTETILLRRLAAEPAQRTRLLGGALGLRLALALAAGAGAVLLAPWVDASEPHLAWRATLAAAALLLAGQPVYRALFRCELHMGRVLGVAAATNALVLLLVGVAVLAGTGIDGVFVAIAAANLSGFLLAALLSRDLHRFAPTIDLPLWRELLREAWPIGANVFVITVALRIGPLLLMRLRGPIEVGWFASASRLTDALNLLADAAMLSVYPLFVRHATARPDALRALAELTAKLLGVVLLGVILLVSQCAPWIMATLFRPEFAIAGPVLALLTWSALLAGLGNVYAHLLAAAGRQAVLFRINCAAAALQIILQLVLISAFGLIGAAAAVVLTAVASHATLALLPETRTWVRPCVRAIAGPTALALVLLALAPLLPLGDLARAVLLPGVFAGLLFITRQVGTADLQRLRELLRASSEAAAGPLPQQG